MGKKSLFHRGQAAEIPPSQEQKIKLTDNFKPSKNLLPEHGSVMLILRLLAEKTSKNNGFTAGPSKYYSLKKIASKLKHIEGLESIIKDMLRNGFIEISAIEDNIRITAKGLNFYHHHRLNI